MYNRQELYELNFVWTNNLHFAIRKQIQEYVCVSKGISWCSLVGKHYFAIHQRSERLIFPLHYC